MSSTHAARWGVRVPRSKLVPELWMTLDEEAIRRGNLPTSLLQTVSFPRFSPCPQVEAAPTLPLPVAPGSPPGKPGREAPAKPQGPSHA